MASPTNLKTHDPFAEFARGDPFFDLIRLFDVPRVRRAFTGMPATPEIRMDVKETPAAYVIRAEMPGVKKEDIHVTVDGNTVSIAGKVELARTLGEGEAMLLTELFDGSVARTFTLLSDLDDVNAVAKCENGMLELTLPKKAGGRARALPVM